MKYKINQILKKAQTSQGKDYASLELIDESGAHFDRVGYFDNPHMLAVGQELEGSVTTNDKGYNNFKPLGKANGGFQGGMGKQLMAEKNANIEKNMDRKEESFKQSGTARDATLISLEFLKRNPEMTELAYLQKWIEFRRWLLEHYEIESPDVPF